MGVDGVSGVDGDSGVGGVGEVDGVDTVDVGIKVFCIDAGLGTDDGEGGVIVDAGGVITVGGFGGNTCCEIGGNGLGSGACATP